MLCLETNGTALNMEEIRRPLIDPENQLGDLVLPDTWKNIPFCLIKAFENTLENEIRQEDNFRLLNQKVFSLGRLLDKQNMELKTFIGMQSDVTKKEFQKLMRTQDMGLKQDMEKIKAEVVLMQSEADMKMTRTMN